MIKDNALQYHFTSNQHSWCTFTISTKGDFFIHSDWGYWAHNWRSFGSDFRKFLIDTSADYLFSCLHRNVIQFYGKKGMNKRQVEAITFHFHQFQQQLKSEL